MRKVELRMKEQKKYEVIKELVEHGGSKERAALKLGITIRQVNRLIIIYKERGKEGFVHGNRSRKPATTLNKSLSEDIILLYKTKYQDFNFSHFKEYLEEEENIKVSYKFIYDTLTKQGISQAVFMSIRLIFLVVGTSLLTLTTSPIQLTDGIERMFNPLKKVGMPVHELAMMMTIALRFIPTLLDETDKIMKAQMSRGADFESSNIINRAKNLVPLLVPLFVSAFRRADELAMAMEARCYRGGFNRTKMKEAKITKADYTAYVLQVVFLAIIIVTKFI